MHFFTHILRVAALIALALPRATAQFAPALIWIDPLCDEESVKAFNEVRWVAGELVKQLETQQQDVDPWLNEALQWMFGFDVKHPMMTHVVAITNRISKIRRTNEWRDANSAIYCDDMRKHWKAVDGNTPPMADWSKTVFFHAPESLLKYGSSLSCITDETTGAQCENLDKAIWQARMPDVDPLFEGHMSSMFICQKTLDLDPKTVRELSQHDLEFEQLHTLRTAFNAIAHEFVHFQIIGYLGIDTGMAKYNPDYGMDHHLDSNGNYHTGYYTELLTGDKRPENVPAPSPDSEGGEPQELYLPSASIRLPEFTVRNPDSYGGLLDIYALRRYGWKVSRHEDWEDHFQALGLESLVEGEWIPMPGWPTDDGDNWTDKQTPTDKGIPEVLVTSKRGVSNNITDTAREEPQMPRDHHYQHASHLEKHRHKARL